MDAAAAAISQPLSRDRVDAWLRDAYDVPEGFGELLHSVEGLIFGSGLLTLLLPGHPFDPYPALDVFVPESALERARAALPPMTRASHDGHDAFSRCVRSCWRAPRIVLRGVVDAVSPRELLELADLCFDVSFDGRAVSWETRDALGDMASLTLHGNGSGSVGFLKRRERAARRGLRVTTPPSRLSYDAHPHCDLG
jgi:hypothetical protein